VVVDVDGAHGRAALAALERTHASLPRTLAAVTARGVHLYFRAGAHRIANSAGRLGAGLDVRGRGGYVAAPPSLHADGHRYRWSIRRRPAPLPPWLAGPLTAPAPPPRRAALPDLAPGDSRRRYFAATLRGELANVAAARPGTRNDTLNRAAFPASSPPPATAASTSSPGRCWTPRWPPGSPTPSRWRSLRNVVEERGDRVEACRIAHEMEVVEHQDDRVRHGGECRADSRDAA
jgi:Bifunctional DNA primase/polymerase, N-terminal